jgi:hypothetical protein
VEVMILRLLKDNIFVCSIRSPFEDYYALLLEQIHFGKTLKKLKPNLLCEVSNMSKRYVISSKILLFKSSNYIISATKRGV